MRNFILIICGCLLAASAATAQNTTREQNTPTPRQQTMIDIQRLQNREREFDRLRNVKSDINRRSKMPGSSKRTIEPTGRDKELISLNAEDKAKFADFLQLPHNGRFPRYTAARGRQREYFVEGAEPPGSAGTD